MPSAPRRPRPAASADDLRFGRQSAPGGVRRYTLHRLLPDSTRRFLGGTCRGPTSSAASGPGQGERAARFELRAVGELYTSSDPVTVNHTW
ncbi:hypothetical protein [Streptomyces sp. F001]|uniref:hypothetical protein n=1 Tax=Streptomyces sp. F001 TaxID=1510026 RepID=UPI003208A8BD